MSVSRTSAATPTISFQPFPLPLMLMLMCFPKTSRVPQNLRAMDSLTMMTFGAFRTSRCSHPCAIEDGCAAPRQAPARAVPGGTSLPAATATRANVSRRLLPRRQEAGKNICRLLPLARFALQLLLAGARQFVVFGFAVVVGDAPLRADVAFLLEFQQRRIQRAIIHGQQVAAGLLDAPSDAVSVQRAQGIQCFQHHQRQRSLPDVFFLGHAFSYGFPIAMLAQTPMGKQ